MKPRFQADADLHPDIVRGLIRREPAIDFQAAQDFIRDGTPDVFGRFAIRSIFSPGLFLVPQSIGIGAAIQELLLIWIASDAPDWHNCIVRQTL